MPNSRSRSSCTTTIPSGASASWRTAGGQGTRDCVRWRGRAGWGVGLGGGDRAQRRTGRIDGPAAFVHQAMWSQHGTATRSARPRRCTRARFESLMALSWSWWVVGGPRTGGRSRRRAAVSIAAARCVRRSRRRARRRCAAFAETACFQGRSTGRTRRHDGACRERSTTEVNNGARAKRERGRRDNAGEERARAKKERGRRRSAGEERAQAKRERGRRDDAGEERARRRAPFP